jgi:hypothetical protein
LVSRLKAKYVLWLGALAAVLTYLYLNNPASGDAYFPSCPFNSLTGLQCPGCGSQRAIHHLLHLNFDEALNQNALLVVSIPYILGGFAFDYLKPQSTRALKWRKLLYGKRAIYVVVILVLCFSIYRNAFS